jgi:hypothetical protein
LNSSSAIVIERPESAGEGTSSFARSFGGAPARASKNRLSPETGICPRSAIDLPPTRTDRARGFSRDPPHLAQVPFFMNGSSTATACPPPWYFSNSSGTNPDQVSACDHDFPFWLQRKTSLRSPVP